MRSTYFCPICNEKHYFDSKIGQAHSNPNTIPNPQKYAVVMTQKVKYGNMTLPHTTTLKTFKTKQAAEKKMLTYKKRVSKQKEKHPELKGVTLSVKAVKKIDRRGSP